jgi:TorA maturation chaperone TorD
MLPSAVAPAPRILAHFWLNEVQPDDLPALAALPHLAAALPQPAAAGLTNLAVEFQRLYGFNLPPYESVFVDASAMLLAPAAHRVQQRYDRGDFTPPPVRAAGPDHLGLELLALAHWQETGRPEFVHRLLVDHLALWAPVFMVTLRRLQPHPFYAALADLTLDLLLSLLPENSAPSLPSGDDPPPGPDGGAEPDDLHPLLIPLAAGLYLTRHDLGRLARALDLPGSMGERRRMLQNLLRLARQYEALPGLVNWLADLLAQTGQAYAALAADYPTWAAYAQFWQNRLAAAQSILGNI